MLIKKQTYAYEKADLIQKIFNLKYHYPKLEKFNRQLIMNTIIM